MNTLRAPVIERVLAMLDRGFLTRHSFEATFNSANGVIVSVKFRDNPALYFQIVSPNAEENQNALWVVRECPGVNFVEAEAMYAQNWDIALARLPPWLDRVIQDHFVSAPPDEVIQRYRKNLDETADDLPEPDKPFTTEEHEEWKQKFDTIVERMSSLESAHKVQKAHIDKLKQQLEELDKQAPALPKRTWLKAAGHRVLDALATAGQETIKSIAEGTIRGLLTKDK